MGEGSGLVERGFAGLNVRDFKLLGIMMQIGNIYSTNQVFLGFQCPGWLYRNCPLVASPVSLLQPS